MAELGQDVSGHRPMTVEELDDWEGLNFDLIITLAPEAHHKALELTRTLAADQYNNGRRTIRPAPKQYRAEAAGLSRGVRRGEAAHSQALLKGRGGERLEGWEPREAVPCPPDENPVPFYLGCFLPS